jgi:hypothetical protein
MMRVKQNEAVKYHPAMTFNLSTSQTLVKSKSQGIKRLCDLKLCDTLETVSDQTPMRINLHCIRALAARWF